MKREISAMTVFEGEACKAVKAYTTKAGILWVGGSQSVVPGPAASAPPVTWLEIHILISHSGATGLETLEVGSSLCFHTSSGDYCTHSGLRTLASHGGRRLLGRNNFGIIKEN